MIKSLLFQTLFDWSASGSLATSRFLRCKEFIWKKLEFNANFFSLFSNTYCKRGRLRSNRKYIYEQENH